MTIDRAINVLVTILLIDMMIAIGLGVTIAELIVVVRNCRLMLRAALANYVCVPALTIGLLLLFRPPDPAVLAGFLILAVCPGAPFGPACTRIARGDVAAATGLMAVLAGSSALVAPLLLFFLLPLVTGGGNLVVDAPNVVRTLLLTQFFPLCLGLCLRYWSPGFAQRLLKPANRISALLSLVVVALILYSQFHLLAAIRLRGHIGMLLLVASSLLAGWLLGGPDRETRKALALTTLLRNVGVGLVIVTRNFGNTAAVTAVLAYGLVEIVAAVSLAGFWKKFSTGGVRHGPE